MKHSLPRNEWLLLVYRLPRTPTSTRVSVWRKLNKLGALLTHDAVWVLPANPRTEEQLQWLAAEILELGGQAMLWNARSLSDDQQQAFVEQFQQRVEAGYRDILASLRGKKQDLARLSRRYQQIQTYDFFPTKLSHRIREAFMAARRRQES